MSVSFPDSLPASLPTSLPTRPSLDWLKKTAKQVLRAQQATQPKIQLSDVQYALATHFGFSSWRALKEHIETLQQSDELALSDNQASIKIFLRHVGAGKIDAVKTMLSSSPQLVNQKGPHPYWSGQPQALHVSIETNRRDMFDLLLQAGANINGDNDGYDQWSPLMLSINWSQTEMREALLQAGANIGPIEALLLADDERVKRWLSVGASALEGHNPNDGSVLAFARTTFAIDRLLELGAATDIKDKWGATPMEAMSRLGPAGQPLVRYLQNKGVQAEPQEYARMGDRAALERLLAESPKLVLTDPVMLAAVSFSHHALVQWLLEKGGSANARATIQSGETALHQAAWNGDLPMVKLLLAAGADIHALDVEHQNTPEGWAKVAVDVSNNLKCVEVAEYLADRR